MTQPIAGVSPPSMFETTIMTIWPGITRFALGRILGQMYDIKAGTYIFTVGNLLALLTAPGGAKLYLLRLAPGFALRYRLTNRRIVVEKGMNYKEDRSVELDRFDSIEIVVRPGQRWFAHGDLVFKLGNTETFRLEAVPRPDVFKSIVWKAHLSNVGVKKAMAREKAAVA